MGRRSELDRLKRVTVRSRAQWRRWLEKNHASKDSIWLVTYKKGSGGPYLAYDEIVEEALCFGWIDSLPRKLDEERTMRMLSPRRPRSEWSKLNRDRVARLIGCGLMREPGLAKIQRAKQDGSWDFLDDVHAVTIPDELEAAFAQQPAARKGFAALSESMRRRLLHYLKAAKGAQTRRKRVDFIIARSAPGAGRD